MKILVTGASGLLGGKIFDVLSKRHELMGTYNSNKKRNFMFLDITDKNMIEMLFCKAEPDLVIHTAAMVNPDNCEDDKEMAKKMNVDGTRNIAYACKKHDCKLVYISSDYVFDGEHNPCREGDGTRHLNYYGNTKLEGERICKESASDCIIIRPSILYGYSGNGDRKTFISHVIEKLKKGERVSADNSIIKYPLLIDDVALGIKKLIELNEEGIFHFSGPDAITKYEWGKKIARFYGLPEENIIEKIDEPIAQRPRNVLLDTSKIKRIGVEFYDIDMGLKLMRNQAGCMFRMIYTLRPDKLLLNHNASKFRINVGKELACEHPADADIVVPVPESGIYSATGYAAESKMPFYFGIIRDYYTDKTLFESRQLDRSKSIRKKLIIVHEIVKGKSIVLVDEAIIAGTTLGVVTEKLDEAGVKEIHVRIPSPPMTNTCENMVLSKNAKLIAKKYKKFGKEGVERELAKHFGVKSLRFLSLEGFLSVIGKNKSPCVECFMGGEI